MNSSAPADISAAQTGDHAAFTRLVEALHRDLRVYIAAYAVNRDHMEEVCQATWVAVWQRMRQWRDEAPFDHWVRGIARNLLREDLRRRMRVQSLPEITVLDRIMVDEGLEHLEKPHDRRLDRLAGCLDRLAPRARTVLLARDQKSEPLAKLAKRFKQPMGALATMLWRIRSTLRQCLDDGAV